LFCIYYNITDDGNWEEEGTNVLFRKDTDEHLAEKLGLTVADLDSKIAVSREKVMEARSKRVRPGLDHKILASWNGLMLKGLCGAYKAFDEPEYLEFALRSARFIYRNLITMDRLARVASSGDTIAFLDDYANVIDAFIALYEITFDEQWLRIAKGLTDMAIAHYYNAEQGIFYYTADDDEQLIARKSEIIDSVIPASNSVMAHNLKALGSLFYEERYLNISVQLLRNVIPQAAKYGSSYSNWCTLLLNEIFGVYEVAITGAKADEFRSEFEKTYVPNKIMLGGTQGSLPLLQDKFNNTTRIFICKDRTCGLPALNIEEALKQIH
jgi:uncharacterized protein YyaL (SSP411 family)